MTAFDDLAARVADLESRMEQVPTDNARATVELQRGLETSWQPDGDTFLLPHSVGIKALEPFCFWQVGYSAQTIPTGVPTELSASTLEVNIVPMPNTTLTNVSSSAWRFRPPYSGAYLVSGGCAWPTGAAGMRYCGLGVNGAFFATPPFENSCPGAAGDNVRNMFSAPILLNMGTVSDLSLFVYQSSGVDVNVVNGRLIVIGLGPKYDGNLSSGVNPAKVREP